MIVEVVGVGAAVVFAGLSTVHFYWAAGGRWGRSSAVPTASGRPLFSPSTRSTIVVASLLAASAAILVGGVSDWPPSVLFRIGCAGIGAVLLARSIGERRYVGFLKRVRDTEFARRDTVLYSPLCLALAVAAALVAFAP